MDLRQPLTDAELDELGASLARRPDAMPLSQARGFLTAVATSPTLMPPSAWQPAILGEQEFATRDELQRTVGPLLRLYNQTIEALTDGTRIAPDDAADDTLALWCDGYLKAARLDPAWEADEKGGFFLFPHAILSGEMNLVGERDADGNVIQDPTPQLQATRARIDVTVHACHRYWLAKRRAPAAAKPGRNEPCSCGSGKKYKKCHGA